MPSAHSSYASVQLTHDRPTGSTTTTQLTQARFLSRFGWGLTKRIEQFGASKFKANIERVRLQLLS